MQVVGPGTPAAEAGLKPGDVIKAVDGKPVTDRQSLEDVLAKTKPKQIVRACRSTATARELTLTAKLRRRPLEVIKPEDDDPLSMLLTLQQFDEREDRRRAEEGGREEGRRRSRTRRTTPRRPRDGTTQRCLDRGTGGREAADGELEAAWRRTRRTPQFRRALPEKGLEITKTYRLAKVPEESLTDADFPAYHLEFEIEIRNIGEQGPQGGLSAGRAQRPADRRQVVCHAR